MFESIVMDVIQIGFRDFPSLVWIFQLAPQHPAYTYDIYFSHSYVSTSLPINLLPSVPMSSGSLR